MQAIYARQSVDKKDSISIEAQVEKCLAETDGNYRVFIDRGYSGKNTNRPEFKNMMLQVKSGSISKIIVYRIDRLSRSIADFSMFWNILEKHGVEFVSVNEKFDTSSPIGRAMLYIIMSFAQLERETIAERIRDNYYARFKRGIWLGGPPPLGFDIIKENKNGKKASFLCPNSEIELVKLIFEMYYKGESLGEIAEEAKKYKCGKERYWDSRAVSRIIRNPVYACCDENVYWYYAEKGIISENSAEDFDGKTAAMVTGKEKSTCEKRLTAAGHMGVIDANVFLYCNRRLDINSSICVENKSRNSFLSGLLKCGICGKNIKIIYSGKKRYMFCSKGCNGLLGVSIDETESLVIKAAEITMNKYAADKEYSQKSDIIDYKINNLVKALENGGISAKYIEERIKSLENMKKTADNKQNFKLISNMNYDEKRLILRLIIEKINVFQGELHIFYRF